MLADPGFLEHFHFLRPAWALLPIPWLAVLWMMRKRQSSRDAFGGIIAPHLLHHLRLNRFRSNWINPQNFTTALFLILLIVLMGPSWRQQPSPLSQDDAALVILLDISASMTQRDVQPSRLRRAKQKVEDLLALRPDKLTSLIVYAGSAHTVLTLTADRAILTQYLAAIEPDIMPRAGKFPEYALVQVDKVLRQSQAPATVVIFADGTGADSRREFSDYFSSRDHQLLVVGVGTQADDERLVPLERESLQALASAASGSYRDLTVDDSDMRWVNRQINSHYLVVQDSALPWLDSGYMLVFPALGLFLMWFRRGWTLTWSWLLVPWLLVQSPGPLQASDTSPAEVKSHWFADQWLTADQQGRILMYRGHYREAARRFDNPTWKAMAYYYAEDFMQAAEYFARRDSDDALFNEANARAHARDYVRAVSRYDRLVARTPDFPGAATNRARVQALIDEINRLSESQRQEAGVGKEEKELGGDDAIPAQGAEEIDLQNADVKQLSAQDILQDPATREMWLRSVQQNPAHFLSMKFNMQLQSEEGGQ